MAKRSDWTKLITNILFSWWKFPCTEWRLFSTATLISTTTQYKGSQLILQRQTESQRLGKTERQREREGELQIMQYDGWCRSRSRNTFSEGWNGSATFPLSIHYFVLLLRARTNEATAALPADQPQQQQDSQRTVFRRRRKGTQNREARGTLALQYSRHHHTHIITQVPCQRITAVVYTS